LNRFGHPQLAFQEYLRAYNELAAELETEDNWALDYSEEVSFVPGMLNHYINDWLPKRNQWETIWYGEKPAVEVEFSIYIPELSDWMKMPVIYQGKFDRIVRDQIGRYWIVEIKTVASFEDEKLEMDPQCSNYCWASEFVLPEPAFGILFLQFKKDCPKAPRELKNGHISTAKDQSTTSDMFRETLISKYGAVPDKYQDTLKALMATETDKGDRFIQFNYVKRNATHRANEYPKILAEAYEMLNKDIFCYPNPTRDCSWDCDFDAPCMAMDAGQDWEYMIKEGYQVKQEGEEEWLKRIKWPK
jgi:hypothetical protein